MKQDYNKDMISPLMYLTYRLDKQNFIRMVNDETKTDSLYLGENKHR
jgi:hypothetical protein